MAAEPLVSVCQRHFRLPRSLASGIGVTVSLGLLAGIVTLLGAVAVRQLSRLQLQLPDVTAQAQNLKDWLIRTADRAPEGIRSLAQSTVLEAFDDGRIFIEQLSGKLPGMVTGVVSGLGNSLLGIGTGVLSAFLLSARLPKLRQEAEKRLPPAFREHWIPAVKKVGHSLWKWCKAQGLLAAMTWGVVSPGLYLLRIPRGILLGGLIALVDAVPILGTGTVLIPWALFCFLQGDRMRGIGLLVIYGIALLVRTLLEPRLVGRQLGLDPLLTLLAMYLGYRFWGIPGLLLTPILASAARNIASA